MDSTLQKGRCRTHSLDKRKVIGLQSAQYCLSLRLVDGIGGHRTLNIHLVNLYAPHKARTQDVIHKVVVLEADESSIFSMQRTQTEEDMSTDTYESRYQL